MNSFNPFGIDMAKKPVDDHKVVKYDSNGVIVYCPKVNDTVRGEITTIGSKCTCGHIMR